jgi:hypothetical protein
MKHKARCENLVDLQKPDEHLDLILCNAIHNLPIVADQFDNHLSDVETDVALDTKHFV